jgi:Icc-related predicted phosphoesterase
MKIVSFSDIHGQHSRKLKRWFTYNPGDLLLFAGDLQLNQHDFGESFIDWVHDLPYTNKVLIFGNHDGNYMYTLRYTEKYPEIKFLMNSSITIDGINIFGSPYSVVIPNHSWWFSEPDEVLEKIWRGIPEKTNILLTHCPPIGIMDTTVDGTNAGSKTLLDSIAQLSIKYHIFGHIQESYGIKEKDGTTFINASLLNEAYHIKNLPVIFDYDTGIIDEYNVGE